jgi:hypothetical protein
VQGIGASSRCKDRRKGQGATIGIHSYLVSQFARLPSHCLPKRFTYMCQGQLSLLALYGCKMNFCILVGDYSENNCKTSIHESDVVGITLALFAVVSRSAVALVSGRVGIILGALGVIEAGTTQTHQAVYTNMHIHSQFSTSPSSSCGANIHRDSLDERRE